MELEYKLTQREKEVLECMCKGLTNEEIADLLTISHHTSKAHVKSILKKLNAKNRTLAAFIAAKSNIV